MHAVSAIALSGLHAAQASLAASAHDIANLGTADFRRLQVQRATADGGGVVVDWTRASTPGHAPESDLVAQLQARNAFLANLAVFRSADAMTGSLLDIRA